MHAPARQIVPATPGLLTRSEFADWLNVGINEVPRLLAQFDLTPIEGRIPVRSVCRQVMKIEPRDDDEIALLMEQLQPIAWVAAQVGKGHSTVRSKLARSSFDYPGPIADLGGTEKRSRSRRWLPAQIRAARNGDPIPTFERVEALRDAAGTVTPEVAADAANNVFAQIVRLNDSIPRQRPK